mgnify:CR=1 FL=1
MRRYIVQCCFVRTLPCLLVTIITPQLLQSAAAATAAAGGAAADDDSVEIARED